MANYPTSLPNLSNPAASDVRTGHADQHANANDEIEAIAAAVGVTGSAVAGTVHYRLDALEDSPAGVTDHGALTGLADDDHAQYHTDARGDARYAPVANGVTNGDSHNHLGGDGAQIAYSSLSGTPTLGGAAALNVGTGAGTVAAGDDARIVAATPAETATTIGALIAGATAKAVPVGADSLGLSDSTAGNVLKKTTITDLLEAIYKAGVPRTLWASGQTFWIPPGDGGSNGMLFAGGGTGAFTLSAAVPAGFSLPGLWVYLTANAGGSGNSAGWHYATMSSDTAGICYADTYDSTSGVPPVFPSSPTTLNCVSATRLTTTTADIQCIQVPFDAAAQMGKNGCLELLFKTFGNTPSNKFFSFRAGANALYQSVPAASPVTDALAVISAAGSLSSQLVTRQSYSVGFGGIATISNDLRTVNLAAETYLSVTIKLSATTDSFATSIRKLVVSNKE